MTTLTFAFNEDTLNTEIEILVILVILAYLMGCRVSWLSLNNINITIIFEIAKKVGKKWESFSYLV